MWSNRHEKLHDCRGNDVLEKKKIELLVQYIDNTIANSVIIVVRDNNEASSPTWRCLLMKTLYCESWRVYILFDYSNGTTG